MCKLIFLQLKRFLTHYVYKHWRKKTNLNATTPVQRPFFPHTSQYNPQTEKVSSAPLMLGPKFPGVESSNAYGPQATATKVEGQRVMAAPHYRGIDIQHRFG